MKTKIIDILNKIANGEEPPKLILFKDLQWSYDEKEKDYVNIFNEWLFDSHVISSIVNCEVEILEQDNIENNKQKLKATLNCIKDSETILGGEYYVIHSDFIIALEEEIIEAINERIV